MSLQFVAAIILFSQIISGCGSGKRIENTRGAPLPLESRTVSPIAAQSEVTSTQLLENEPQSSIALWEIPSPVENPYCSGKRIGLYSWDTSYWMNGNSALLDFLDSEQGQQWNCGDIYVNIGDYSSAGSIIAPSNLVEFALSFRQRSRNHAAILYFTYGDVTAHDGDAMVQFTHTFFDWVDTISAYDAAAIGRIGISYDVEHFDPVYTERVLALCRERRKSTAFGEKGLLIQYLIEGDENIAGTDIAFRYADSVLAMLYSNSLSDISPYGADSLISRLKWFLTSQCKKCLDDEYSESNYTAKITIMVEASCKMGRSCSWASFCAHDGPDEGVFYLYTVLEGAIKSLPLFVTEKQFIRLFSLDSLFVVNSFEWYRCYTPFDNLFRFTECENYHSLAEDCRMK